MAIKTEVWIAKDGSIHKTEQGARKKEAALDVETWLARAGIGVGGEWSLYAILGVILEHSEKLVELLTRYNNSGEEDNQPSNS